ncbi:hypothetical protein LINGRAHAP2_LOCUS31803 [Linum grandiflorum]
MCKSSFDQKSCPHCVYGFNTLEWEVSFPW